MERLRASPSVLDFVMDAQMPATSHFGHATTTRAMARVAAALLLAGALALGLASPVAGETGVERIAGADRVGTAVAVSQAGGDDADVALLAEQSAFPDALVAASLAARRNAPLLFTHGTVLSEPARAEITRLGVDTVLILGGTAVVSEEVEAALVADGLAVERRAGPDRYGTAAAIALDVGAQDEVLLALGEETARAGGWPDAIAAASLAGAPSSPPTLLTTHDAVPETTLEALETLTPQRVRLLGGEAAISADVASELEAAGYEVARAAGVNRYATATAIASAALEDLEAERLRPIAASATSLPDAVLAGALAARLGQPFVFAHPTRGEEHTHAFLRERRERWDGLTLVGGEAAVSEFSEQTLIASLAGEPWSAVAPEPWEAGWEPAAGWETWDALAQCESGGRWDINTGNGFYGGLQFHPDSWRAAGGTGWPHEATREEQIYRGERLQSIQGWGAWPTCARRIGLL